MTLAIRKSRFTIALMWALIPVVAFAAQPRMGCICANGQHKFFCQRHSEGSQDARCTCCFGRGSETGKSAAKACCGGMACCGRTHETCESKDPVMGATRSCRPVVETATFLNGSKAPVDLQLADAAPLFVALDVLPLQTGSMAAEVDRTRSLPPPDLVVTLGVRLI
jgi:hypothetical protein